MNGARGLIWLLVFVAGCRGEKPSQETQYYAEYASRRVEARGAAKQLADRIQDHWASAQKKTQGVPDMDTSVLKFVAERMTLDAVAEWTNTDQARAKEMNRRRDLFDKDGSVAHMFDCLGYIGDNLTSAWLDTHARIAVSSAILRIKNG